MNWLRKVYLYGKIQVIVYSIYVRTLGVSSPVTTNSRTL